MEIGEIRHMIQILLGTRTAGRLSESEQERYEALCEAENDYLARLALLP
jgi:hypothetical protein